MYANFKEPSFGWPTLIDFHITILGAVLTLLVKNIIISYSWSFFWRNCKEQKDEEIRYSKTYKASYSFFKLIYFTLVTLWGWYLMFDTYYLTPLLLGKGDMTLAGKDYPLHVPPKGLKYYYLGTMGYHLYSLVYHALAKARNDFIEMFLHHSVTIFLYGFSYYGNFTVAGSIIMYLHDIADIFTSGVRAFTETNCNRTSAFFGIMMTISWFYTRLVVYPIVIY